MEFLLLASTVKAVIETSIFGQNVLYGVISVGFNDHVVTSLSSYHLNTWKNVFPTLISYYTFAHTRFWII